MYAAEMSFGLGEDIDALRASVRRFARERIAPIAAEVLYVATPGAANPDYVNLPYTKRKTPFWPKVADPFA